MKQSSRSSMKVWLSANTITSNAEKTNPSTNLFFTFSLRLMARSKDYQRLLNDKRWTILRRQYLQTHPICERCKAENRITAAVDCHHKIPVESAKSLADMEQLCYSWSNLQALCIPCHIATHKEMGKSTKKNHQQREHDRVQRWLDKQTKK